MSANVVFVRPVEKVGVIYDILMSSEYSNFPVVDTDDNDTLSGTIGRSALCILLQQRAFGRPTTPEDEHHDNINCNYLQVDDGGGKFYPLVQWNVVEKAYPKYPKVSDLRIDESDRENFVDLRPYTNVAALTTQETSSVSVRFGFFVLFCFCFEYNGSMPHIL
mmetsp:Transcript_24695/g.60676  ORF Transcript_24695/g.60676 Transcript_24695/m.60676 type:complete len:163 (+) Transcript_24695:1630-2118(+)